MFQKRGGGGEKEERELSFLTQDLYNYSLVLLSCLQ